jgi:hypothetical protein
MTAAATAPTASTDVVTMAMIVLFLPSGFVIFVSMVRIHAVRRQFCDSR